MEPNAAVAPSESSSSVWGTIRSYVLWQHERGTLHYDIMVTLILIFIFFSPRVINFNDKPALRDSHPSDVVVSTDEQGLVYEIPAADVNAGDDSAVREQLLRAIQPISGDVAIVSYQKVADGGAQRYRVHAVRK